MFCVSAFDSVNPGVFIVNAIVSIVARAQARRSHVMFTYISIPVICVYLENFPIRTCTCLFEQDNSVITCLHEHGYTGITLIKLTLWFGHVGWPFCANTLCL